MTAVVEGDSLPAATDAAPQPANIVAYSDTRATVETDTQTAGVLVLADVWFPGWKATVDGKPVGIDPANLAFRGVVVPPGRHLVEFRYEPTSTYIGLGGVAAAIVIFSAWSLGLTLSRKRLAAAG
jgi:uncharacterized membrane protein YfhO